MTPENNLTPGAALAALFEASTPEEKAEAKQNLDLAHAKLVQSASEQGIKMTFITNSPETVYKKE